MRVGSNRQIVLLLVGFALVLVGCGSPSSDLAIGAAPTDAPSGIEIDWVTCIATQSIELHKLTAAQDVTVWKIDATDDQRMSGTFVVGQTPPGYRETVAVDPQALQGDPVLHAIGRANAEGGSATVTLRASELRAGQVMVRRVESDDHRYEPVSVFQAQATASCPQSHPQTT